VNSPFPTSEPQQFTSVHISESLRGRRLECHGLKTAAGYLIGVRVSPSELKEGRGLGPVQDVFTILAMQLHIDGDEEP
jgi:hypothetical protein